MTIEVSAFRWVPRFAQGLVRDLRVRWALEEANSVEPHVQPPALDAYVRRCEARPAFRKAFADQMAPFATHAPASP